MLLEQYEILEKAAGFEPFPKLTQRCPARIALAPEVELRHNAIR
jgi:hypothetical protein